MNQFSKEDREFLKREGYWTIWDSLFTQNSYIILSILLGILVAYVWWCDGRYDILSFIWECLTGSNAPF